jgi:cardiolipin synthase
MRNKPWLRALLIRRAVIILLLLVQIGVVVFSLVGQTAAVVWLEPALRVLSIVLVLHIASTDKAAGFRQVWVVLVLLVPVAGIPFYLLFRVQTGTKKLNLRVREIEFRSRSDLKLGTDCYDEALSAAGEHSAPARYLQGYLDFPVRRHTRTHFFSPGETFFDALLADLEGARRYIFLEYFIVNEGWMWDAILEILKRKAAQGVDVRLLYDDMGCFLSLPTDFDRTLAESGIRCAVFNPFTPFVSAMQNNRDHRKICSVDGKIAYTGGINLADEYINHIERFGHWKDCALRLEGEGAWSMTVFFLEQWELTTRDRENYARFYPWNTEMCDTPDDGYVLPYVDSPVDTENVCENVYLHLIHTARDYLYICSPYLIVDDALASALTLCAKSGVDVRIITPDKADKRFVHFTTQSYYRQLIHAGVRIYQYTGGFIHSKTFVSDDVVASVGTANLDYRSLYLNFECGVWMWGSAAVAEIKRDFLETLPLCREMAAEECSCSGLRRLWQEFLRLFAPLM